MSAQCPKCGATIERDETTCPKCRTIIVKREASPEDAAEPKKIILAGAVLAGDYKIVRFLGRGGVGTVYEARQISLENMRVAVKIVHRDLNSNENCINLLKKEVIIARELTHENIIKIFSLETVRGRHFIVMEYMAGESLLAVLKRTGKLSIQELSPIFLQVCDALQYSHARGIIHLDVKPANILVGKGGNVKLCDFGIARMAIGARTTATQRLVTGSLGYMPPEQYSGRKAVTTRSDIYALGATVFHGLTGNVPVGVSDTPGVPSSVLRAMKSDPEERFESVKDFRDAFVKEIASDHRGRPALPSGKIDHMETSLDQAPAPGTRWTISPQTTPSAPVAENQARVTARPAQSDVVPPTLDQPDDRPESPRQERGAVVHAEGSRRRPSAKTMAAVGALLLAVAILGTGIYVFRDKGPDAAPETQPVALSEPQAVAPQESQPPIAPAPATVPTPLPTPPSQPVAIPEPKQVAPPPRAEPPPKREPPALPAALPVAEAEYQWFDRSRNREVPVKVYYPESAVGPFPVVVFSHDVGGTRQAAAFLGRHWAAAGYVSVHVQHRGSDAGAVRGGPNPRETVLRIVRDRDSMLNRPHDISFVIGHITRMMPADAPFRGNTDPDRVGVAGHSLGAFSALAVAGQSLIGPAGREMSFADPRVKAVIAVSPPVPKPLIAHIDRAFSRVTIPCLHVIMAHDRGPTGETPPQVRRMPFDHMNASDQYLITFKDADNMVLAGPPPPGQASERHRILLRLISMSSTAFWDAYLKRDAKAKAWLSQGGFESELGAAGAFEKKLK